MTTQPRGNTITINNMNMYYETCGEGKPLLILHGFTGSSARLADLFKDFTKTHQLIIPDLRGHGRSSNPSKKFTFHQAALDVFALLDHLNIENCSAVGFSGGGCTLLQMAYQRPDKIKSMALLSAAPYFPAQTREIMRQIDIDNKTEEEWTAMRGIHLNGDEQIRLLWQQSKSLDENSDDMNFTSEKLSQITTPTFIIQGDRDPLYPIDLTIEMYKSIPNASLWIIPNGGHVPISNETIPEFLSQLDRFFKN